MLNFREFQAGPDPFGRTYQVLLKWLQTAISIRHSDTVDVKFILRDENSSAEKTIALRHAEVLKLSAATGHELTDAWCSRLAALHLQHLVETGEDLEKDLVTLSYDQLQEYAARLAEEEKAEIARLGKA
jgi:hypothetical protein